MHFVDKVDRGVQKSWGRASSRLLRVYAAKAHKTQNPTQAAIMQGSMPIPEADGQWVDDPASPGDPAGFFVQSTAPLRLSFGVGTLWHVLHVHQLRVLSAHARVFTAKAAVHTASLCDVTVT